MKYKYKKEDYPKAEFFGRCSFTLTLSAMIFTFMCAFVIIGSVAGSVVRCHNVYFNGKPITLSQLI